MSPARFVIAMRRAIRAQPVSVNEQPCGDFPVPYVEPDKRLNVMSWGSVIAGALTVLAVSLLLSLLISGLGLSQVDLPSNDPLGGVSATVRWTSVIALLVSLAAGGYLAGYLSGVAGWVHGFLTWALAMLVAAYLSFAAMGAAINVTGSVLSGAASATGTVAGAAGDAAGGAANLIGDAASSLAEMLDTDALSDVDGDDLAAQLRSAAGDADLDALEPELIEQQLAGARDDIAAAGEALLDNPQNYEDIAATLLDNLRARVETLDDEISRDDLITAISANTTLEEDEVEEAADQVIALYEDAAASAREQLNTIEQRIESAQADLKNLQAQAIEQADRATAAAASAALWSFFGALLGAIVAVGAGIAGARSPVDTRPRY